MVAVRMLPRAPVVAGAPPFRSRRRPRSTPRAFRTAGPPAAPGDLRRTPRAQPRFGHTAALHAPNRDSATPHTGASAIGIRSLPADLPTAASRATRFGGLIVISAAIRVSVCVSVDAQSRAGRRRPHAERFCMIRLDSAGAASAAVRHLPIGFALLTRPNHTEGGGLCGGFVQVSRAKCRRRLRRDAPRSARHHIRRIFGVRSRRATHPRVGTTAASGDPTLPVAGHCAPRDPVSRDRRVRRSARRHVTRAG
ncbi:hypothetical protein J2S41_006877 [Catenuloplanes atrovinosus]|uniref:Uncharacterized protein n=1 Tax=Catenuloplanes atrovinosus TaxID=137266 RepID=A0AAE3YUF1_9ACTN|nr:hypothetical protein [Catenuloplanes atrovinosus]